MIHSATLATNNDGSKFKTETIYGKSSMHKLFKDVGMINGLSKYCVNEKALVDLPKCKKSGSMRTSFG